jgi:hypothetical protein
MNMPLFTRFFTQTFRVAGQAMPLLLCGVLALGVHVEAAAQTPGGVVDSIVFWLNPADINNDGGATNPSTGDSVSTWSDISGSATTHDFDDATDIGTYGDLIPPLFAEGDDANAINYRPVLSFHANDAGLQTPNANNINTTEHTLKSFSVVFRSSGTAGAGTEVVYEEGSGTNGMNVYTKNGDVGISVYARSSSTGWEHYATQSGSNNTVYLATVVLDGARDSTVRIYLDGTELVNDSAEVLPSHSGRTAVGQVRQASRGSGWNSSDNNG